VKAQKQLKNERRNQPKNLESTNAVEKEKRNPVKGRVIAQKQLQKRSETSRAISESTQAVKK
jgi:hypothetical protein